MKHCIVLISLLIFLGCQRITPPANEDPLAANGKVAAVDGHAKIVAEDDRARVIVDRLGRTFRFVEVPQRIISLSPSTTELLFAIGAGPQIVGATQYCDYPAEASQIPRVGAGTLESMSRETILSLKPDLVLCQWDNHQPLIESLERLRVPVIAIGPEKLKELFEEATLLGQVLGHELEASQLIESMTRRLDRLTSCVNSLPQSQRRTVFYEVWDKPLMTAGPNSFIGELLVLGGMKNIFSDTEPRYPRVSDEVVVHRDPEVILAPSTHADQVSFEKLAGRQGWGQILAIREKQVFLIDGDQVSRCGPRLLDALESMIEAVYPQRYATLADTARLGGDPSAAIAKDANH